MDETPEPLAAAIAMSPFIVGLVEVAKRSGLPSRWSTLVAIAIGLVISFLFAAAGWAELDTGNWATIVLVGLAGGLMAVGLYSGVKTVSGRDVPQ